MDVDISLQCPCGGFRGVVRGLSPRAGFRVVCYCDDCQAFAHYLGRAEQMLDPLGGTDIFQTSPARVEFVEGTVASMRLAANGMLRWYSACCRSPVGNTFASRGLPFVGILSAWSN